MGDRKSFNEAIRYDGYSKKIVEYLSEKGVLLFEAHTFSAVKNMGERPPFWYSSDSGLFSDQPCIRLREWERIATGALRGVDRRNGSGEVETRG